ncbi:MAG TPA: hypothetical protein VFT55_00510, partial [Planctomycetota bacterium]|nr:hypothetical protein [Planctomycetota bacterium]
MLRPALALTVAAVGLAPAQQFIAQTDPSPAFSVTSDVRKPVAGARGWFRARDSSGESGLYVTDGTVAGTTRVLDGFVTPVHEFAGRLLFINANISPPGNALYSTDGTAAGTVHLVANMEATVTVHGSCNGRLVFSDRPTSSTSRIWSTDMTPGGTIQLGQLLGTFFATTLGNEVLLFGNPVSGTVIHATNGTNFVPRFTFPLGNDLHHISRTAPVLGNHAYFLARYFPGTSVIDELWRTDGTTVTTVTTLGPSAIRYIGRAGNGLVITGDDGTTDTLFSDGTAAGTTVMTSAVRGFTFTTLGSLAFFVGSTAAHGSELWRTDGTSAGTFPLMDATPGPTASQFSSLTPGTTTLYCFVNNQFRLLASDGTVAGTRLLSSHQVLPVANSGGLAVLGDTALVVGQVPTTELLASDGTTANTVQLTSNQIRPGMNGLGSAAPLLDELCFVSDDSLHGREIWRSDGTPGGTSLVEDIAPGPADGVGGLVAWKGGLWFGVGGKLYRSDGTAAGRTLVFDTGFGRIDDLQAGTGVLSFRTPTSTFTAQLWRSNGVATVASPVGLALTSQTLQVGDDTYYTVMSPARLHRWNGQPTGGIDLGPADRILGRLGPRVVFIAGATLRITDGTPGGTATIGQLPAGSSTAQGNRRDGGTFLVVVDNLGGVHATDGASLATLPLPTPSLMTGGDDLVYLQVPHPTLGAVLYVTDGTLSGTQKVADFGDLSTSRAERMWPLGSGNRILLAVRNDTDGVEPWISDGTNSGTAQLADLNPNGSSDPELIGTAGSIAYFAADDGLTGPELWRLDLPQVAAANVQPLGTGCPGSFGEPLLASGDTPRLGTTFTMTLSQAMPNSFAVWLLASQLGVTPVGGGCTLYFQGLDAAFLTLTDASGASAAQLAIPNVTSLMGLALIQQVGVLDPLGAS